MNATKNKNTGARISKTRQDKRGNQTVPFMPFKKQQEIRNCRQENRSENNREIQQVVARNGIEPLTRGFTVPCSTD